MKMRLLAVVAAFTAVATVPLRSWEADVHYGLTRWLAEASGLRPAIAEQIAQGNLAADTGTLNPATVLVPLHIMILNDRSASKRVQKLHFPSYARVPGPPRTRRVSQDSVRARDWLDKEIRARVTADGEAESLEEFGLALHSLQDSWSHEGVPDIAGRCANLRARPDLSWAHPVERGGWAVHDADQTYRWQADAKNRPLDMARATYQFLRAYGDEHKEFRQREPQDWRTLEPAVVKFIAAATKEEKAKWFSDDQTISVKTFGIQSFIQSTSLPASRALAPQLFASVKRTPQVACDAIDGALGHFDRLADEVSGAIQEGFERFLGRWLSNRNVDAAMDDIDLEEIGKQIAGLGGDTTPSVWSRKFLTMWLLDDHGFVNSAGHGLPGSEGYGLLPGNPADLTIGRQRPPRPWQVDIDAPGTGRHYAISQIKWPAAGRHFAVSFRFQHLPHDSLVFVLRQQGQGIRVARMSWLVE